MLLYVQYNHLEESMKLRVCETTLFAKDKRSSFVLGDLMKHLPALVNQLLVQIRLATFRRGRWMSAIDYAERTSKLSGYVAV